MIDIHTHVLPGIDDGADSMDTALELLALSADSGVDCVVTTHHCNVPEEFDNYASPDFFVRYLKAMWRTSARAAFLASLPRPGSKGTLQSMFQKSDKDFKARIRMKSGSMNGVLCYSGYILPKGGSTSAEANIITFSILTNNASVGASKVRPFLEELIRLLAEEN